MSNRSLIEVNHDYTHEIERDPEAFVRALVSYLRAGYVSRNLGHDEQTREIARGVRVFGMRHHSDPFSIDWGGCRMSESRSGK